jgi:hypothetical protein
MQDEDLRGVKMKESKKNFYFEALTFKNLYSYNPNFSELKNIFKERIMKMVVKKILTKVILFSISLTLSIIAQELPVKKVVIYKNGISYIERETNLNGDGTIQLKFKPRQMRDILKTLYAVPLKEGTIQNIDYEGETPLSKKLEDINIPFSPENFLSGLIKGLQGVKVHWGGGNATLLGIETKKSTGKDGQVVEERYVVFLRDNGQIDQIPIENFQFTIEDENIKKDFEKLLTILNSTKYASQKNVSIYYKGFNSSPLRVGYVIESPIWKTTYRVFLDAKPNPLVQSFAIVENDTLDDWKDVNVVLVGVGPFSYLVDLYTSIVPARPSISVEELFGIVRAPSSGGKAGLDVVGLGGGARIFNKGKFPQIGKALAKSSEEREERKDYEATLGEAGALPSPPPTLGEIIPRGLKTIGEGKELGEYFAYEIANPITISKGNAGLVNILSANLDGEKILYFNEALSQNVLNGFYLKNNSNNVLDSGFVTFFEGQSVVGEGYLKRQLKNNDKEIITYGIERSVSIEAPVQTTNSGYTSAKLVNGTLTLQYYYYITKTYKIFNRGQKNYTLLLDHNKSYGMELVEPADTTIREDLPNLYRFKVSVKANSNTEFKVVERKLEYEYIYLDIGTNLDRIAYIISSAKLSENAKKIVQEATKIIQEIRQINDQINKLVSRNNYLRQQLDILRNNISTLYTGNPQEANIRAKQVATLDKYMTEYEENENTRNNLETKRSELRDKLSQLISSYSE